MYIPILKRKCLVNSLLLKRLSWQSYLYHSKGYIPGWIEGGILLCLGIIDVLRKCKLTRSLQQGLMM